MDYSTFQVDFMQILQKNGLNLFCRQEIIEQFYQFTELFLSENAKTNLSAIRAPREIIAKHFADCLLAVDILPEGATVLDVGCGGGFPCIPFAIVRPDLQITAIDSTQKKIDFVKKAAKILDLKNLMPICGRIEEKKQAYLRERFSVVTSRAVANLQVLAELTLPFVKVGGFLLALKGAKGSEEAETARQAIVKLGGLQKADLEKTLYCPMVEAEEQGSLAKPTEWIAEARRLILIEKIQSTPKEYPRAYAAILKRPL
ncbi:MAG: 16S rRNA (guanine(527)-N(7))-methyltransferase RsmG [Ruminococcaceae bacterium]|nr:16S rRNA (guanine(527)-N(7))-methyltransferase RsmG [Oscillospiraceae bacterium]